MQKGEADFTFVFQKGGGRFPWMGWSHWKRPRPDKLCCVGLRSRLSLSLRLATCTHVHMQAERNAVGWGGVSPLSHDLVLGPYHHQSSPDGNVPLTKTHIALPNFYWIFLTLQTFANVALACRSKNMRAQTQRSVLTFALLGFVTCSTCALCSCVQMWVIFFYNAPSLGANMQNRNINKTHDDKIQKVFRVMSIFSTRTAGDDCLYYWFMSNLIISSLFGLKITVFSYCKVLIHCGIFNLITENDPDSTT